MFVLVGDTSKNFLFILSTVRHDPKSIEYELIHKLSFLRTVTVRILL